MITPKVIDRRIIVIGVASLISLVLIVSYFGSKEETSKKIAVSTTTTTTLPPKNAQACEYLTSNSLLAGGIISDVDAKTSDGKKRCTYEDIGGQVNYLTLYVDVASQCEVLISSAKERIALPEVGPTAVYTEVLDPTIIVSQASRCYFVQGSKTLVSKENLIAIAKSITELFTAVDSSTTTTTQTTIVLPEVSGTTLPGQNTAAPTTTAPAA